MFYQAAKHLIHGRTNGIILQTCILLGKLQILQLLPSDNFIVCRCDFGLCALNGYLYAVGGWVNDKEPNMCDSIERYDPKADQWTVIGHLAEPRFSMGLEAHDGKCCYTSTIVGTTFHSS